jgi:hypothetical protein
VRDPAVPAQQLIELLARDPREHAGVGDLVAVQVQDRQHGAVGDGVEELIRVPRRRERSGFGLAVADDAGHREIGVVEDRAECMAERIPQLAAFMDAAGRFRCDVTRNTAGKRELPEENLQSGFVLRDRRIDLAVGPFEIRVGDERWSAVPGTGDVDHVEVALVDDPVQVHIDEVLARRGAPVAEQSRLDMCRTERFAQERVVKQIDLADREIVGGAPIRIHPREQVRRHRHNVYRVASRS